KSPNGTIRLQAYHQANQVVVEVRDDGQGINAERVKTRAVEQGMITAEAAAQLSESEILDLIFQPGLSTAEQITEVSGRGVGKAGKAPRWCGSWIAQNIRTGDHIG